MAYNESNLIKYEDTIRLHFDKAGKTAWLTMKNYGYVFGTKPEDAVRVVTVGHPATEDSTTISIGEMLDVNAVITLQVAILAETGQPNAMKSFTPELLIGQIEKGLYALLQEQCHITYSSDNVASTTYQSLRKIIADYHGALEPGYGMGQTHAWTEELLAISRKYEINPVSPRGKRKKKTEQEPKTKTKKPTYGDLDGPPGFARDDFTAYFPNPRLIPQEQRTRKQSSNPGHTFRTDTRDIKPIPANMRTPQQWEFFEILKTANKMGTDVTNVQKKTLLIRFAQLFSKISESEGLKWRDLGADDRNESKVEIQEAGEKQLHIRFNRLNCFGFRGDDRAPQTMKNANGFLPGVTRTDQEKTKAKQADLEETLGVDPNTGPKDPRKIGEPKQDLDPEYENIIKEYNIMNLGEFITEQDFKGFVSATKSTAIAKCFANLYTEKKDPTVYCYAVRLRGAFEVPSTVPEDVKDHTKHLQSLWSYIQYAEQELTQPGAIWWDNIVGLRVIRCNDTGQYFSGPIFLRDCLMWDDNYAFSELFELFSGKSQGESGRITGVDKGAAPMIGKSYETCPFPLLSQGLAGGGANQLSAAITFRQPAVRLSKGSLTFLPQPVNLASAGQEVNLTNTGDELLIIEKISFQNGVEFGQTNDCARTMMPGASCTINVTYKPLASWESTDILRISYKPSSALSTILEIKPVDVFGTGKNDT